MTLPFQRTVWENPTGIEDNYKTDKRFDYDGGINKRIIKIFNLINNRGHVIGLHPGYMTFDNKSNFKKSWL